MKWNWIFVLVLAGLMAMALTGCPDSDDDDDDDDDNFGDDDDDDASDSDKATIFCDKMTACDFLDDLEIDDCTQYALDAYNWMLECTLRAKSCRELAECFNLPEFGFGDAA